MGVRQILGRLIVTAAILLLFGVAIPAVFGVERFSYLRLSVLVLAATVLLLRWLKKEERPYDRLDEFEAPASAEPAQRTNR
jgi:hypothetical protein